MEALNQIDAWGAAHAAAGVAGRDGVLATRGPEGHTFRWASVTKLATALATLVAAEEGTVDLDEPAGPPGATVRHLLAHASGLPFEGEAPIADPGKRRIYSNTGFERLAAHVEAAAEMPFAELERGVPACFERRAHADARAGRDLAHLVRRLEGRNRGCGDAGLRARRRAWAGSHHVLRCQAHDRA